MKKEEALLKSCACIYKLSFPNGKSYVGKSKDLGGRIKIYERNLESDRDSKVIQAIREFGFENVDVEILSEPKNLSKEDLSLVLCILEISYIRSCNTIFPNGYNVSIGGEILGIPSDCITTENIESVYTGGYKPVLVYDLDGNFVSEYPSIERCAYALGVDATSVSQNLDKRKELFRDTYMLRRKKYGKVPEKILPFKPEVVEKTIVRNIVKENVIERDRVVISHKVPVLKYNLDGEFCGEFESAVDAAMSIGRSSISKGIPIAGYIFFDHDGGEIKQNIGKIECGGRRMPKYSDALNRPLVEEVEKPKQRWSSLINSFSIGQYSRDGELLNTYPSIRDASEDTGFSYAGIWACVFGKTRKSHGFIWRKIDSEE